MRGVLTRRLFANVASYLWRSLSRIGGFFRRHIAETIVATTTIGTLAFVGALYFPSIFSDYGRVEFGLRFDCDLTVDAVNINLVDPPNAFMFVQLSGFSANECDSILLRDDTDVMTHNSRSFIATAEYSDGVLFDIAGNEFENSAFHVRILKDRLRELYTDVGSDEGTQVSDTVTIGFTAPLALIRTSFSRAVLPIFPAIASEAEDANWKQRVRIIVRAPQGYIFASSAPHQPTQLVSGEQGVIEAWFDYGLDEPGFVVYFENARGAAIGELLLFFASGVFGFAVGFFVDRMLPRRKAT